MYTSLKSCRICGNDNLELVLDLGIQALTGVFPRDPAEVITEGPLQLVKCMGEGHCGLLQLGHSYELAEMYGDNYGYRSGLNKSMVRHLNEKVAKILLRVDLRAGDLVVDIGSNDSTTLQAYPETATLVGVDPTGTKFREYYPAHIQLIPDFFSAGLIQHRFAGQKAKVVTSFSMFYDLPDPLGFMRDIHEILADDGIWVFEQSYMPAMLETNSYDTACHEHLEYYALKQIKWMADRIGFTIVDVEFNDINGGSFSVTVQKSQSGLDSSVDVAAILEGESLSGLDTLLPVQRFAKRVASSRDALLAFVDECTAKGETIAALGASTKGNVVLQYCKLTSKQVVAVGEVNAEKFGAFTPGSLLPIVPQDDLLSSRPDYLLVLPWHFRKFFETDANFAGQKLVFALPTLEVVTRSGTQATTRLTMIEKDRGH